MRIAEFQQNTAEWLLKLEKNTENMVYFLNSRPAKCANGFPPYTKYTRGLLRTLPLLHGFAILVSRVAFDFTTKNINFLYSPSSPLKRCVA